MSTKTTFKRVALVTVAALGFGLLSSVIPATAATSTGLVASVGPNGATSLTVVGGTDSTTAALVRLDVTVDSATSATGHGLQAGESITATVTGVPSSVTAKTVAANGGSLADTATAWTGTGYSDFVMIDVKGQGTATVAGTAATSTSVNTDWTKLAADSITATNWDSNVAWTAAERATQLDDGLITSLNTGFANMDATHQTTGTKNTKSYYVSINPRAGATVQNQGAYTFSFQLTDAYGIVRATKTVTIDFVTVASKSDAVLALATSGTFLASAALDTVDSATAVGYATLTMTNRSGGLVRTNTGAAPAPLVQLQKSTTAVPVYTDSPTVTAADSGVYLSLIHI